MVRAPAPTGTVVGVQVTDALRALGGCARAKQIRALAGRRALARAVTSGAVTREGSVYKLPTTTRPQVLARELRGVRSHCTAAAHWGFALPPTDDLVDITVPNKARRTSVPEDVDLHFRDHRPDEVDGDVTAPLRTVLDCLRDEPLRVALSVGDSALASGKVTWEQLDRAVRALRGPRSLLARLRLRQLDARSANAFESSCRAILLDAGITGFQPQVAIRHKKRWVGRVDLADRTRRIVIECDGFAHHGDRDAFVSDLVRHTKLVAAGWRPLRFTWEQVMFRPEWVLEMVQDVIDEVERTQITVKRRQQRRIAA